MLPSRSQILIGSMVSIFDNRDKKIKRGKVDSIWTNSETHPHGIKVRLQNNETGRVVEVLQICSRTGCNWHQNGHSSALLKSVTGKMICNVCFDQENQIQQQFGSQGVALFWK